MPDKKPFKVLSPIQHDGKNYEIGSMIELEPEQAISLIRSKVVAGDLPPVKKSQREIELEATIADLRLDLETALRVNKELADESSELKKTIAEPSAKPEPKKTAKKQCTARSSTSSSP